MYQFYGTQGNQSIKFYPRDNFKRPFLSVYKQLINIISVSFLVDVLATYIEKMSRDLFQ